MKLITNHKLTHSNYYNSHEYISNSMLNELSKSPAHLRYSMDHPQRPTPAMKLGSAIHMNVLQPELFNKNYAVSPKFDRRTKQGKADHTEFINNNKFKTIISEDDFELIEQITLKVKRDDLVNQLLRNGEPEKIIVWNNENYNIHCKGMIDYWKPDNAIIVDLKTTQDASIKGFTKSIIKYKYHKQAAFYMDAVGADEFYIVAVEKSAPYMINVFQLSSGLISEGRRLYNKELEIYKYCVENDYWPEYGYDFFNQESERQIQLIDSNIIK